MKFLLVFAVLAVAYWVWRSNRRPPPPSSGETRRPAAKAPPQLEMVRCAVCGLHLPKEDAVNTAQASYCGAEHRRQAER